MRLNEPIHNGHNDDGPRIVMVEIVRSPKFLNDQESPFEPDISQLLASLVESTSHAIRGLNSCVEMIPEHLRGDLPKAVDDIMAHARSWSDYIVPLKIESLDKAGIRLLLDRASDAAVVMSRKIRQALRIHADIIVRETVASMDRMLTGTEKKWEGGDK